MWSMQGQHLLEYFLFVCGVREYRRGNNKWTIQRNWQHKVYQTQDNDKKAKNTTQYMLDSTMHKQTLTFKVINVVNARSTFAGIFLICLWFIG
jgi:hypothetical protein